MRIKRYLLLSVFILAACILHAQDRKKKDIYTPVLAVKTNLLYWATASFNGGLEIGLSKRFTLDISGSINPWDYSCCEKMKYWIVQPELRYWTCDKFSGHFFGLHGHAGKFNIGGMKIFDLKDKFYQGDFWGGGLSYGYQWILSPYWSLEATIGVGYARMDYDKYTCDECNAQTYSKKRDYFGPTKVGINLVYILK